MRSQVVIIKKRQRENEIARNKFSSIVVIVHHNLTQNIITNSVGYVVVILAISFMI